MVKNFDNEFYDELKDGVVDNIPEQNYISDEAINTLAQMHVEEIKQALKEVSLEDRKKMLQGVITVLESYVVKDPEKVDKLKKELTSVEEEIKNQEKHNTATKNMDESAKEEAEKEEELKDERSLNEDEKEKSKREETQKLQAYHDTLMAYYEKRVSTLREQNEKGKLVSDRADYNVELELEDKMYIARDSYMSLGKSDPYVEQRKELERREKEARDKVNNELNRRAAEYRRLEEKLKTLNQKEREIREQIDGADVKDKEALQKELDKVQEEKAQVNQQIIEVKTDLGTAIEELRRRAIERAGRGGLESRRYDMMSKEEKANYSYLKDQVNERNNNYKKADKLEYNELKKSIEKREVEIKMLNEKLKNTPETDFEERLKILQQLDEESYLLKQDREAKSDIDRGIALSEIKAKQEAEKQAKGEKENSEEFTKATEEMRAASKEQERAEGEEAIENPSLTNINKEEEESTTKAMAAGIALSVDSSAPGPDTVEQNVGQYAIAKCSIEGLENSVRNPNKHPDAEEIVAENEKIDKVKDEQEKVLKDIEQKQQG